jgi:hypothetical protein
MITELTTVVVVAAGALAAGLTWLASRGILPINPVAGIRLPSTTCTPEAWRAGHRAALPVLVVTVVVMIATATALLLGADPDRPHPGIVLATAGVLLVGTLVSSAAAASATRRL